MAAPAPPFVRLILGLEGYGPRIAGARTSANIDLDFFAGLAYGSYASLPEPFACGPRVSIWIGTTIRFRRDLNIRDR